MNFLNLFVINLFYSNIYYYENLWISFKRFWRVSAWISFHTNFGWIKLLIWVIDRFIFFYKIVFNYLVSKFLNRWCFDKILTSLVAKLLSNCNREFKGRESKILLDVLFMSKRIAPQGSRTQVQNLISW